MGKEYLKKKDEYCTGNIVLPAGAEKQKKTIHVIAMRNALHDTTLLPRRVIPI
jgi:hypothetical protein